MTLDEYLRYDNLLLLAILVVEVVEMIHRW